MKTLLKPSLIPSFLLVAAMGCSLSARADIIAADDFNGYSTGSIWMQTTNAATGFSGTEQWTTFSTNAASNLFTINAAGQLVADRFTSFDDDENAYARIVTANPVSSVLEDEWFFRADVNIDAASFHGQGAVDDFAAASFDHYLGGSYRPLGFAVGNTAVAGEHSVFLISGAAGSVPNEANPNGPSLDTGLTLSPGDNTVVVRASHNTSTNNGQDELEIWINPDPNNPGPADFSTDSPNFVGLVQNNANFGFEAFEIYARYDGENLVTFDNLALATTFAEAANFGTVPEPSTYAMLLGMFGLLAVGIRRRRHATTA